MTPMRYVLTDFGVGSPSVADTDCPLCAALVGALVEVEPSEHIPNCSRTVTVQFEIPKTPESVPLNVEVTPWTE